MKTSDEISESESKAMLKARILACNERLYTQQQLIKDKNLPVIVLIEGWGAAGKGELISRLIGEIDSRFYKVSSVSAPSEEDKRKPFLHRHFCNIPEGGKFLFLDSGWMDECVKSRARGELSDEEYRERLESIRIFERQLVDGGYLLIKIFLDINKSEQSQRIQTLLSDKDTSWRVGDNDKWQNSHFAKCYEIFAEYLEATSTKYAPWNIIDATKRTSAQCKAMELLTRRIDEALNAKPHSGLKPSVFPLCDMPRLCDIDLSKTISDTDYKKELKAAQKKLHALHNRLYRLKKPVVIVYEGFDAAGKGGNIKRVTSALDARGYEVLPIAAPEPHEKSRHYLWRFWNRLPKTGHIAIFDRSWYGRVMVERIEGFCSESDWQNAYGEINEFEKELTDWGAIVVKFWVHIDNATQLERFTERQNIPEKQWKITDEDWRNREKWAEYETAVNEMLTKTSTVNAPWHIIESVDKHYARVKALKILIAAIENEL
ncbi:MAG: polyphosphate:AMP phosphotransferase [Oscillospiraceae bacterium]